ncbi:MAG: hypothetical protein U0836_22685 [Pirellulales bacterium]
MIVVFLCSLPLLGLRLYIARLQCQYDVLYRFGTCDSFAVYHEPLWPQWFWQPLAGEAAISVIGAHLSCWDCAGLGLITENELSIIQSWDLKGGLRIKSNLVDDAVMRRFCGMRRATSLIVEDAMVTDAGLSSLPQLAAASYLVIDTRLSISDEGIAQIVKMPALEHVQLSGRGGLPLTNVGLERLAGKTSLWAIHIDANGVTNDGLRCLSQLPVLHTLHLNAPLVTPQGISWLVNSLRLHDLVVNGVRVDLEAYRYPANPAF